MRCPRCDRPTHVVDSRQSGTYVRRTRKCGETRNAEASCGYRFRTIELPANFQLNLQLGFGLNGVTSEVVKKK